MHAQRILVLGGSGFVGRALVPRLDAAGYAVTVPTRRRERARGLILLPRTEVIEADIHDPATLARLTAGHAVVINLVGILHGRPPASRDDPFGPDFRAAHVTLVERLLGLADTHGVERLVQVSALGVPDGPPLTAPSCYLRSKAEAERLIRAHSLPSTIFRPSVMFGPGDGLLTVFADLQRLAPVVLAPGLDTRFQPIYVVDVAEAIVNSLARRDTVGRVFELAGPEVLTLRDIIRLAGQISGHPRPVLPLPPALGHLQALVMEHLPGPTLMSRDNLLSMKVDNVASGPIDPVLGIHPASMRVLAPTWLGPLTSPFNAERAKRI